MELRQVRYFLAVAEQRHFGRAAEQLHVVQPAVSQQIRRLEHELGVRLFHRTTRTVELTATGAGFVGHAREIVAAVDRAVLTAQHAAGANRTMRIGTGSGLGSLLTDVLEDLRRGRHPPDVELVRMPEPERLRRLVDGRLDAVIVRGPAGHLPRDVQSSPILTEALVAAMPAARTTRRRRTARLAELATMPVRLPERAHNPVLLDALAAAYERVGMTAQRIAGGTDQEMLALIANGPPSWTVFYPQQAELLGRQPLPAVAFRRIAAPRVVITTSVAFRADNPHAVAFCEAFRATAAARGG